MYTVYSCRNTNGNYYYRSWHGGKCPHCGGPLDAECVSKMFYDSAES